MSKDKDNKKEEKLENADNQNEKPYQHNIHNQKNLPQKEDKTPSLMMKTNQAIIHINNTTKAI